MREKQERGNSYNLSTIEVFSYQRVSKCAVYCVENKFRKEISSVFIFVVIIVVVI
jgi:hypothetical protein